MALDAAGADTEAFLVKLPHALAARWKQVAEQSMGGRGDDSLGRIVTEAEEDGDVSYFELPDGAQAAGRPLPRRFRLQRMPLQADGASKLHVASYEAPADKGKDPVKPRIDGAVTTRLDMLPMVKDAQGGWVMDTSYVSLARSRTEAAADKARTVVAYDNKADDKAHLDHLANTKRARTEVLLNIKKKAVAAKAEGQKQHKMEADALQSLLFRLYERSTAWSFKALLAETEQPQAHLRTVLDSIAVLQKRGPNKDKYELKPEYRRRDASAPGGAAGGAGVGGR